MQDFWASDHPLAPEHLPVDRRDGDVDVGQQVRQPELVVVPGHLATAQLREVVVQPPGRRHPAAAGDVDAAPAGHLHHLHSRDNAAPTSAL